MNITVIPDICLKSETKHSFTIVGAFSIKWSIELGDKENTEVQGLIVYDPINLSYSGDKYKIKFMDYVLPPEIHMNLEKIIIDQFKKEFKENISQSNFILVTR